ncbi:MAG: hypothetical protein ACE148_08040 [Vicinamibacterales bacterium]
MADDRGDGIRCPICSKIIERLDENGCSLDAFRPCRHYIGQVVDGDWACLEGGYESIERARALVEAYVCTEGDYDHDEETGPSAVELLVAALQPLLSDVRGLVQTVAEDGDLSWPEWLEHLPNIEYIPTCWDGGAPGMCGTVDYVFARAEDQRRLVKLAERICAAIAQLHKS